jgi:hypothetical protein
LKWQIQDAAEEVRSARRHVDGRVSATRNDGLR